MINDGEHTSQTLPTNSSDAGGSQRRLRAFNPATEAGTDRSGQIVGDTYRLLERIGMGGMAEVYAAEHLRIGQRFAVKVLRVDRAPKASRRFRREAEAIARVQNEYVVSLIDCGEFPDGTPYLVMELLRGVDLRRLLQSASPLPIPRAVNLVWDACQGVSAVHRAGLIHRDLKPENLFAAQRATGEDWCKVLDFGVAKLEVSGSTAEGALVGTVRYMAPEQLLDGASAGPTVDVYALGAILYECLCGESPHSGTSIQELMFKIMNEQPRRLERLRPEVPAELAAAVARALHKDPQRRFKDVPAFARAIAPFRLAKTSVRPGSRVDTVQSEATGDRSARAESRKAVRVFVFGCIFGASVSAAAMWAKDPGSVSVPPTAQRLRRPSSLDPGTLSAAAAIASTSPEQRPPEVRAPPTELDTSLPGAQLTPLPRSTARKTPPLHVPAGPFPSRRFDPQNPYPQ
jgi:eukaryotic-like serine/threonine-protein kinase